jgi:HK97 family phage major capsid protein
MSKLTDLIEKKNTLLASATELVTAGLKTPEARDKYKSLLAEVDSADEMISMLKRVERFADVQPKPVAAPVAAPAVKRGRESKRVRKAKISAAFRSYFRGEHTPEVRSLLEGTDAGGGALVPQEFSNNADLCPEDLLSCSRLCKRRLQFTVG